MYIYLITFLLFLIFIYISTKIKNRKFLAIIFELIGLSILSLTAGARADTVGTDILVYVKPIFNFTSEYGTEVFNYFTQEIGYLLLNYIVSLFTSSFNIYLFIMQFIMMSFSYYGIKKIYPEKYLIVYMIFLFLFYNKSFNLVRQSIAIGICLYSMKYVFSKEFKKFIFFIILAYFFHKTAFLFILVYFIYNFFNKIKFNDIIFSIIVLLLSFILLISFPQIIELLVNFKVLSSRYLYYLTSYVNLSLNFNLTEMLLDLFLIFMYLFFYRKNNSNREDSKFYFILLTIDLACLIISGRYESINRLGLYFKIPALLYFLSSFDEIIKLKNYNCNYLVKYFGLVIAFIFWYSMYVVGNNCNTVPYISSIF